MKRKWFGGLVSLIRRDVGRQAGACGLLDNGV